MRRTIEELCHEQEAAHQDNIRNMSMLSSSIGTLEHKWEKFSQEDEVAGEKYGEYI